jgi:predicted transcriptional regulator
VRKILLSINPEYVSRILSFEKKYEYRRRLANDDVEAIIIYATSPIMRIVGEVKVDGKIEMAPSTLWESTKQNSGISRKKYREYFKECKKAYAYKLGQVTKYEKEKLLSDIGIQQAPQSFVYLTDEQYEKLV